MKDFYIVKVEDKIQVCHFNEIAYFEIRSLDLDNIIYTPILKSDRTIYSMTNKEGETYYANWLKYCSNK